jgi:hypothetical protein
MNNQTARTLYAHKIRYGITGAPMLTEDEMEGSHAPGIRVAPALIELVYSAPRDGKPASVSASVTGPWTRFGERADGQMAVHFKNGPEGWPVWLAEEARLHDPDAAVCICGHTEAQHFEDACLACDCGDYLVPEAAREVIARWRDAATGKTADRATVLRQSVNDPQQADDAALESAPPGCWYDAEAAEAAMWAESMAPAAVSAGQAPATDRAAVALAEVRRLCELTIKASVRVQAIDQARDTLTLIDRIMGADQPGAKAQPAQPQTGEATS